METAEYARRAPAWVLLLAMVMAGVVLNLSGAAMTIEDPFSGEDYDFSPMRTLTLATPVSEYGRIVEAVKGLAGANGYKFRVASPAGRPESIIMDMWTRNIVVTGSSVPEPDTLKFAVYWNGDVPDDSAMDRLAEQLRASLAPFGSVAVAKAPPGTVPREK